MRRADRLMKITHFLRSRRFAVTAQQIADEFEICTRTVYRDIQDLVVSGAPIMGEAGIGYIIDKSYYLPPITFNPDELEAIGLGLSAVRQITDDQFAQHAQNALEKIKAALPNEYQGELEQLTLYSMPSKTAPEYTVSFSRLRESIRNKQKLDIAYCNKQGEASSRIVRPLALIFFSPIWLLVCWCEKRQEFRSFRIDRIESCTFLEDNFEDDETKNISAFQKLIAAHDD